jgi:protein disulfide-isomerase
MPIPQYIGSSSIGPSSKFIHLPKYLSVLERILGKKLEWQEDYQQALKQAVNRGAMVMAFFTGSDWCPYCKALHDEVFESQTFRYWFNVHKLVPLLVDFPSDKPQSEATVEQNAKLKAEYNVEGFPTVIALEVSAFCTSSGTCDYNVSEKGRVVGYTPGSGPDQWINQFSAMAGIAL